MPLPAPVDDSGEPASLGTQGLGASSLPAFFPETSTPNRSRARPSLPGQLPPNISISGAASSPNASAFSPPTMPPPLNRPREAAQPPPPSWASAQSMPEHEYDVFALGRAYFDAKEHERAAKVLEKCRTPKARFLGLYAAYLVR